MTDPRASRPAPLCVRLITFDLDGTLVDTASEIAEAANRTLHEIGLPRRPLPDVTRLIGHGTRELMRGLLAQAVVRDTRTLELLTDVYSTAYPLTAERKSCTLRRLVEHGEREAAVREILETGQLAQEVSDAYVTLGAVTQSREGTRLTLAAEAYVTVLYRTEDGACSSVTRQLQAACPLELPEDASCTCLCSCTAPVFATPTAGGIEVRFSLSFSYTALTSRTAAAVAAVQLDESAAADHAGQPSIVLRVVGAGERLWDIAKAYGTTSRDIVQANGLEEELAPEGQLLLIPRKR